jgi:hypothetical protein
MTVNSDPTTRAEFRDRLDDLIADARRNDVDVEGGWACRETADQSDYEVLISEVIAQSSRR